MRTTEKNSIVNQQSVKMRTWNISRMFLEEHCWHTSDKFIPSNCDTDTGVGITFSKFYEKAVMYNGFMFKNFP